MTVYYITLSDKSVCSVYAQHMEVVPSGFEKSIVFRNLDGDIVFIIPELSVRKIQIDDKTSSDGVFKPLSVIWASDKV